MAREFWVCDAETDPFLYGRVPEPFLWGAYNPSHGYFEFSETADIYQFFKDKEVIVFAHNGGKFDFHFFADYLTTDEKILLINARLVQAKMGKCELRDSYALLPFPLRQIGNKLDIDYKKLEKNVRHLHTKEISEYLKRDCVALYEAIDAFFNEYGRHLTAPSAAIKTLMKIEELKIENSGQGFFSEFQQHYFGGRCECLRPGEYHKKLTYLDINSAYPRAMMEKHPIGSEWTIEYKKKPKIIPQSFYTIEAKSKGAFCRREKIGLVFDWDMEPRTYYTTGWELQAALDTNSCEIIRHISQKHFTETKSFEKFVTHFWEIRQLTAKGSLENTFAKLMMNSAYGKFCANPENYDTFVLFDPAIAEFAVLNEWELRGELGNNVICSKPLEPEYMRFYNVATGASTTGYVRSVLLRAIKSVNTPIYCDTDSLVFSGSHKIDLGNELGQWKIEGEYNESYFAGKKLYAVKNKHEEKISSKGAKLSFEEIKQITKGEIIQYNQDSPTFSWLKETKFTARKIRKTSNENHDLLSSATA